MKSFFYALIAISVGATLANTASRAANLYVPNYSFESQPTPFADPRVDFWQKPPQPPFFDTNVFGAWENLAGVFANPAATNAEYISNADNSQLAYLFSYPGMALFQDYISVDWSNAGPNHAFDSKYEVGKSYTLTVSITGSTEAPLTPGSTLELSFYYRDVASNMVTIAASTVTFSVTTFSNLTKLLDFKVTVPAVSSTNAWAGKNIGIQFLSTASPAFIGGVWDLDNVRLTESIAVPNFSFESQVTAFADPRVDSWQKAPQPATFDTNIFGAWDNLTGVFANSAPTNSDHIDNVDANQLAYLFSYPQVALFQDNNTTDWSGAAPTNAFNAKFKPGRGYTFTAGFTSSSQVPVTPGGQLLMSLYYRDASSNMVPVAATTVTYDTNTFNPITHLQDFTAKIPVINASDIAAGKNIGIHFESIVSPFLIGGVWDIDNVRLVETVTTAFTGARSTSNHFTATLLSEPNTAFEIVTSTNITRPLATWTSIATFTNTTGSYTFTDSSPVQNQRFYRARQIR